MLFRIITEAPPPLLDLRPELPPGLVALIEVALSKAAAERPQSAAAFGEALAQFTVESWSNSSPNLADDHTLIDPGSGPTAAIVRTLKTAEQTKPARRHQRGSIVLAALTFGAGLALGAVLGRSSSPAAQSVASQPSADATGSSNAVTFPSQPAATSSVLPESSASSLPPISPLPRAAAPRVSPKASTPLASGAPTSAAPPLFFPQDGAAKH